MLSAKDIGGLMAMMPAFATDNAADIRATNTVDVAKLHKGVDRMIGDGANVMAAAGSFGEFHTLLPDEFEVLANETVAAVKKRIPVFVGTTSLNGREVQKYKSGPAGKWDKLGPWNVRVTDGAIRITTQGGAANIKRIDLPLRANQPRELKRFAAGAGAAVEPVAATFDPYRFQY